MITKKFENSFKEKEEKIKQRIKSIQQKIKDAAIKNNKNFNDIVFMAVTKNVEVNLVNVAIKNGINVIGENKVQELEKKYPNYLKNNLKIHFIGHLQTNKVKNIIPFVNCIESVDSFKLAETISKYAKKINRIMPIFLEINIGEEKTKFGFKPNEVIKAVEKISKIPNIKINGLMTIPPQKNVEKFFKLMQKLYIDISNKKIDNVKVDFLSMGMSSDFEKAIDFSSNLVRIGGLLFKNLWLLKKRGS